ncbi:MAG: type II toxin-antitoxin system prevent-host-death family antitoxin [Actinomycetota bacterium]|nr:type II toxin-antitoxin system prevent-host-death family antitoxin [Actinomycetota bacterium]MDQ3350863.1 type II toxin-antitoxin system prevent-host-death family antitoxin [Actinomycetota bacterium]
MSTVSVSQLKARLSEYLREVRRGGEVHVLDRGEPVAKITAIVDAGAAGDERARLIRSGMVRPGSGDARPVLEHHPIDLGGGVVDIVIEDRADRL